MHRLSPTIRMSLHLANRGPTCPFRILQMPWQPSFRPPPQFLPGRPCGARWACCPLTWASGSLFPSHSFWGSLCLSLVISLFLCLFPLGSLWLAGQLCLSPPCLSLSLSVSLSECLSTSLCVCIFLFVYLYIYLHFSFSLCLPVCLSVWISMRGHMYHTYVLSVLPLSQSSLPSLCLSASA